MKHVVAIIPARGGSKGIPNKNLVPFCGKPLVAWSIKQIRAARGVGSVWVTSDSDAILQVAVEHGARAIRRPESISGDTASSESAWLHALDEIEKLGPPVDLVVAAQATSPLREALDVERALEAFETQGYDSLFSGAELEDFFIWQQDRERGLVSLNYDSKKRERRQDVAKQFVENGSFYVFKPWVLRELNNRLGGKIGVSPMAFWKTFEIDSLESLEMCEALMRHYLVDQPQHSVSGRDPSWHPTASST